MKKATMLLLLLLTLTACVPTAGRPAVTYAAPAETIIGAIAQIGVQLRPGELANYYSVTSISDRAITLQAETSLGWAILLGGSVTTINITALQQPNATTIAATGSGPGASESIERIILELDRRYQRLGF